MDYKTKYLKYKTKYLQLKNQKGGDFASLNASCLAQIAANKFHSCPNCYYKHTHIRRDDRDDEYNTYRTNNPGKTLSVCTDLNGIEKYFIPNTSYNLLKYTDSTTLVPVDYKSDNILDTNKYVGIKSYTRNSDGTYIISKHTSDIHTLCAEGNIVWVSQKSKVGSTNVDTCMFVVIILDDDSKICIHHGLQDESNETKNPDYYKTDGEIFKNFYENDSENLTKILNNSGITTKNIKTIYLLTENPSEYAKYSKLYYDLVDPTGALEFSEELEKKYININGKSLDIIVDNENNILKIERKS